MCVCHRVCVMCVCHMVCVMCVCHMVCVIVVKFRSLGKILYFMHVSECKWDTSALSNWEMLILPPYYFSIS
jgi:hypothetical protein